MISPIKKKITISIIAVIIITGVIVYVVILPTVRDIKKINQAVYAERADLEKKYLRGQLLKKTLENFEKIKPEKDKLASVFITEGDELKFITTLEKIAADHGVTQNLVLQPAKDKDKYYFPLALEIRIEGEFKNSLGYLRALEKLNYYNNISSIKISAPSEFSNLMITTLTGEVYSLSSNK